MTNYQLKNFLPFVRLLVKMAWPDFVLMRDKNPCLRFCTLLDGLYVSLGPPSVALTENERNCIPITEGEGATVCVIEDVGELIRNDENALLKGSMRGRINGCLNVLVDRDLLVGV